MSIPTIFSRLGVLALLALGLVTAPNLDAQGLGSPPTFEQCTDWAAGLAAGDSAALDVLTFGNLPACPDIAPPALASAIQDAHFVQDTVYAGRLASEAARVRNVSVFMAARDLAADKAASNPSRVMGLLILVAHLGFSQDVPGTVQSQLFTQALPATGVCGFYMSSGLTETLYPEDAERLAAQTFDRIRYDATEPALLRSLARCARTMISPRSVPPQVDLTKVRFGYLCGNAFSIRNQTGAELMVSMKITAEKGAVESHLHRVVLSNFIQMYHAPMKGVVEMWYDGQRVGIAANGGTECPW